MAQFDLPLEELSTYLPPRPEPEDFDAFWRQTLDEARAARRPSRFDPAHPELSALEVFDVTFTGFAGQPIRAWLILPRYRSAPLPAIVEFIGYGGGRGLPIDWLTWSAAGYAHFVMDTRGQGGLWVPGETADPDAGAGPEYPGFLTRGVLDPSTYLYRRIFTDAAMAVDAVREHEAVDPARIVVAGGSQGGAIALAAAALDGTAAAALIDVPFLCHVTRAIAITDAQPYTELRQFLALHRTREADVMRTLSYVDGMNFAARSSVPALMSVGLHDDICPPSTVFAAFNHYAGPKEMKVWPHSGHEAGHSYHVLEKLRFLAERGIMPGDAA